MASAHHLLAFLTSEPALDPLATAAHLLDRLLHRTCDVQMRELPAAISDFVERHEVRDRRQLTLRLV
jgi:hypothetical protein